MATRRVGHEGVGGQLGLPSSRPDKSGREGPTKKVGSVQPAPKIKIKRQIQRNE